MDRRHANKISNAQEELREEDVGRLDISGLEVAAK